MSPNARLLLLLLRTARECVFPGNRDACLRQARKVAAELIAEGC